MGLNAIGFCSLDERVREHAGLDRYQVDLVSVIREISTSVGCRNHIFGEFR